MSFLFISHASPDKPDRIRPLVEALVEEGETVWIDKPGTGPDGLGFEQSYIDSHNIIHLRSGRPWPPETREALRQSGAVIGCLSKAVLSNRSVLKDELTFANVEEKLVTCIVDDLRYDELPEFGGGLLDLRRHQSIPIDCGRLRTALDRRRETGCAVEQLAPDLAAEWEKVRHLIAQADRVRPEPRPLRPRDIPPAAAILQRIPVGPVFYVRHLPRDLLEAFGNFLDTPERMESALSQAETVLQAAFPEGFTPRQVFVRRGQLPPPGTLSPEAFWMQLFAVAGLKGRRTLASFLVCPMGRWALRRAGAESSADDFLEMLSRAGTFVD